jgi:hypothetical protein
MVRFPGIQHVAKNIYEQHELLELGLRSLMLLHLEVEPLNGKESTVEAA